MNFEKAYKEMMNGKKIRRKEWERLMHLRLIDDKVKTFRGEVGNFYQGASILTTDGWRIVDDNERNLTFVQALEELKNKKSIYNERWGMEGFIFVDQERLVICREVEYEFMPEYKCLISLDWEVMK